MDLTQLLRSQARRYRCSACQHGMADCAIDVLAQQGNRALVRVTCASCRDENLLQIVFQTEGGETDDEVAAARRTPLFDEPRPEKDGPISADELLDLHSILSGMSRGDLRQLVTGHPGCVDLSPSIASRPHGG